MQHNPNLDPAYASDRNTGSTPPESGEESSNVVGRPGEDGERGAVGFHEGEETAAEEREPFSGVEALNEGGSFDGLGIPVADD